jgi:hypothetical protein
LIGRLPDLARCSSSSRFGVSIAIKSSKLRDRIESGDAYLSRSFALLGRS